MRRGVLFWWQRRSVPSRQTQSAAAEYPNFKRLHLRNCVFHRSFGHRRCLMFGDKDRPDTLKRKDDHDGQCFNICMLFGNKWLPLKNGEKFAYSAQFSLKCLVSKSISRTSKNPLVPLRRLVGSIVGLWTFRFPFS